VFAVNRNFPNTIKFLKKATDLIDKYALKNILILENNYVPNDLEKLADKLSSEEMEELKKNLDKSDSEKAKELDDFLAQNPKINHVKVNLCSNKAINDVFFSIINIAQTKKKGDKGGDSRGAILGEAELSELVKSHPTETVELKSKDELDEMVNPQHKTCTERKCTIF